MVIPSFRVNHTYAWNLRQAGDLEYLEWLYHAVYNKKSGGKSAGHN